MKIEEFKAWVNIRNIRNTSQSLYINTTGEGPMVYMIPVRPVYDTKGSVRIVDKTEKEAEDDDEGVSEEGDAEPADGM